MKNKQDVAYHEAGHAIAYFALDIPFDKICIVPDGDSAGAVHHPIVDDPDGWDMDEDEKSVLIDKHVMICFAGGLAQERFSGSYDEDGCEQDRFDAIDYASRRCNSTEESEAYLNWLQIRTKNLVNHPVRWFQIQRLAEAMLDRQELSFDEALKIYRDAATEDLNLRLSRNSSK